ncbi:MAG: TIGR03560 family F420-dependent LLM class oxidoreductase [Candidatus Limnocylindrales bacterium]
MRFALMIEPQQGLTYVEQLAVARTAEEAGFEALLRSDHYASFPGGSGLHTTDAWAVLAGVARETTHLRLGTLVSPVTFRMPGSFAKVVATVDEMSGGRVEVGMGAGWNAPEHERLGIPFPPLGERMDRLEEALTIVHGLWTEPDGWSFEGRYWQVHEARFGPRPTSEGRRHPHLIVGGEGKPRGLRLAARFADEYNLESARTEVASAALAELRAACVAAGRDPASIVFSAMVGVLVGASEGDVRDRVAALLAALGLAAPEAEAWLAARRERWIMGTPEQALERIAEFAKVGVERIALQDFVPRDLAMIRLLGERVLPGGAGL